MSKVHFILDEFSSLGKLDSITQALDVGRGYAVRLQFYVQDLAQLRRCFPEDEGATCLGNTTLVAFATNSLSVAETLGKRFGKETRLVESGNANTGGSRSWQEGAPGSHGGGSSWGQTTSWAEHGRDVLFPDEILAASPRTCFTFVAGSGLRPVATTLLRYHEESWLWRPPTFRRTITKLCGCC